jgi:hypothetical protein
MMSQRRLQQLVPAVFDASIDNVFYSFRRHAIQCLAQQCRRGHPPDRARGGAFDALPDRIRQLGPWVGSREGDLANLRPHYRAMMEEQGFAIIYSKPSEFTPEP